MLLGKPHAASDIYSPLFGPSLGFKSNSYNTVNPPTDFDARRFGEKPYLIYTSWLLNRRFGERKRKGQIHFGHSMSRSVTREAIQSFPRPAAQSSVQRFRGETGFQLYSWYVVFHYTIERHREVLLWSYIIVRSDTDKNGNLGWAERQIIMEDLEEGMGREGETGFRKRMFLPHERESRGCRHRATKGQHRRPMDITRRTSRDQQHRMFRVQRKRVFSTRILNPNIRREVYELRLQHRLNLRSRNTAIPQMRRLLTETNPQPRRERSRAAPPACRHAS